MIIFVVVLVAVAVAVMAKIVSVMQFAAYAKRNTLYGRLCGSKSKFWVTTISYNYGATLRPLRALKVPLYSPCTR